MKSQYLDKLKKAVSEAAKSEVEEKGTITIDALETKQKGRPLLLGVNLDESMCAL